MYVNRKKITWKTITLENGEEYKGNIIEETDDIIKLLKQNIITQNIIKLKKRQKDQTKLGWMLRGIKVKNRGMRFPYDLEHYIRGFIG